MAARTNPDGKSVTVIGAGIFGLWQAYAFVEAGFGVTVYERHERDRLHAASSALAGAMLAPWCEVEAAERIVGELGEKSLKLWRQAFPDLAQNGTLVLAHARDLPELDRFKRAAPGYEILDGDALSALEPDLSGRFSRALFYPNEAHLNPRAVMADLIGRLEDKGAKFHFGADGTAENFGTGLVIDARGHAAADVLSDLRGIKGEMLVLRTREINLSRPVRLLHPRHPLYIVPWGEGDYMIGATMIEAESDMRVTAKSILELLSAAYTVHPAFGEAELVETRCAMRPAFPDNLPRLIRRGSTIYVNGAYRHGFLLAPAMAEMAVHLAQGKKVSAEMVHEN